MSLRRSFLGLALLLGPLASLASAQQTSWTVEPAEVHLGQPSLWRMSVVHDADDVLDAPPETFEAGGLEVRVVDGPRLATLPAEDGLAITQVTWRVVALEPGQATTPELDLKLETGLALEHRSPASLNVLPELGPDEDAPRALLGAAEWAGGEQPSRLPWVLGAGALALLAGGLLLRRGRGEREAAAAAPDREAPLDLLRRLAQDLQGEAGEAGSADARAVGYGVSEALRAATEARTACPAPAHALPEWLADQQRAQAAPSPEQLDRLRTLLERAEALKFGPAEGRLSLRDLVRQATELTTELTAELDPQPGQVSA